jgi:uncharacterized membrane protein YuzA (DUF378 family)
MNYWLHRQKLSNIDFTFFDTYFGKYTAISDIVYNLIGVIPSPTVICVKVVR